MVRFLLCTNRNLRNFGLNAKRPGIQPQQSEIQLKNGNQNPSGADKESEESKAWNSESKTVLDYFTYGDKYELTVYNLQRNMKQTLPFPFSFSIFENLHTAEI